MRKEVKRERDILESEFSEVLKLTRRELRWKG